MKKRLIDIIATGSGCSPEILEKACAFIENLGFIPRYSEPFFDDHPLYICNDTQRLSNLQQALYAEDSDFIWCLRGGSGTSCLLPKLLELKPPKTSKTLLGFSDVTALHQVLTQHWGWKTLHGPTLNAFALTAQTKAVENHIIELLKSRETTLNLPLALLNKKEFGSINAPIVGGNLSLIQRSLGTPWQLDTQGKIIFFEDVNEAPYRIAEKLSHLTQAGLFQGAKAILLGDFSQEKPQAGDDERLLYTLQNFANSLTVPVLKNFAVGHIKDNHPVQLNALATLSQNDGNYRYHQHITL